jgi:hydroxyacyl-ACP dehydratase HTD2-like protein with hotdog domain
MTQDPSSLAVGQKLPPAVRSTSIQQVFRYSAATWNTHRIHYDKDYATHEGYPDVLVQSHLHGAFLTQYCTDWMGPHGRLAALSLSVRKFAIAGEQLTCSGEITAITRQPDGGTRVELSLTETRGSDGEICVPATAVVEFAADSDSTSDTGSGSRED